MRRCTRCILTDAWPGIQFDAEGVCDQCRSFERRWGRWFNSPEERARSLRTLEKKLAWARKRKRGEFDVLVPLSGGKDSVQTLRILRHDYGLRALAYTYDNGLLSDRARTNLEEITKALDVEHVFLQPPVQARLLKHFVLKTGNICGACFIPMVLGAHRTAREHGIALIVFGLSRRTDGLLPEGKNPWHFRKVVEDGLGLPEVREVWGSHPVLDYGLDRLRRRVEVICLPDYLPWDEEAIAAGLERDFGIDTYIEHADCIAAEHANWLTRQRYGFGLATIKLAQLVRAGKITREEALARVPEMESDEPPESIHDVAERLGISADDIISAADQDESRYYRGLFNTVARIHRRLFLGR